MINNSSFSVQIGNFNGPLDLLLQLIEKRKMHISDISLAQVTDDYINYLKDLNDIPKDEMAEFLVVASTLMVIKSASLLPEMKLQTPEEETSAEELKRRLEFYQYIKNLSENIRPLTKDQKMFFRKYKNKNTIIFSPSSEITLPSINSSILNLIQTLPLSEILPKIAIKKVISLQEVMDNLLDRLQSNLSVKFSQVAPKDKAEKVNIIMTFIGMLELVKNGMIDVIQEDHFSEININHKPQEII